MALNIDGIADFVETVLDEYVEKESKAWVDISLPLQKYHFAEKWFKDKKKPVKGGPRCKWKLRTDNQGTFKHTGLFATDKTNRKNVMTGAKQEWSMQTVNYIFDLREEEFQGENWQVIVDTMETLELSLYNDFFAGMETSMWTAPASSSTDPRPPSGIPFWLQKCTTLGFNGGDPSGFTDGAGGISTSDYADWKNYGGPYVEVSRDDLIEKVINAMDFCYFKPPQDFSQIGSGQPAWGLYTVHSVLATMRKIMESQNDNLGHEAGWGANGEVMLRRTPVTWVPALTNSASDAYDSENPFYGINWNLFQYFFQENQNMVKHPLKQASQQHAVRERHMDNAGNFVCYNRREGGFVFHVA